MNAKSIIFTSAFTLAVLFSAKAQSLLGNPITGTNQDLLLGFAQTLSNDGTKVAIQKNFNHQNGAIQVLNYDGNDWVPFGNDIPAEIAVVSSVITLSFDGTKLAYERSINHGNGNYTTSFRVYNYTNGAWSQLGTDINQGQGLSFGLHNIALSANGQRIVISSKKNLGNTIFESAVRIYDFDGNDWVQLGNDVELQNVTNSHTSSNVSISSDGNRIATSTPSQQDGHTRIYGFNANSWVQLGSDIRPETNGDFTGWRIQLSSDGNRIAISEEEENNNSTGKVRVFEYKGVDWEQIGNTLFGESLSDNFGLGLDLSANGNKLAIGSIGDDTNGEDVGKVSIFQYINDNWVQINANLLGTEAYENYGYSVSLSDNGNRLAIGSPNFGTDDTGQVKVYDLTTLSSEQYLMNNSAVYPNPATGEVLVALEQDLELQQINLYSSEGKLIKSEKKQGQSQKIDLNECKSQGTYYLELITQKGKATKKIVVKQ